MAKKPNRVCKVCHDQYYFCPNCAGVTATEKYKTIFCSKNCRDIFQTCVSYDMNHIIKDEAREKLSHLDLSKKSEFSEQLREEIDAIMEVEAPQITTYQTVSIAEAEEAPVEPEPITPVFDTFEKKSKRSKRSTIETYEEVMPED